MSERGNQIYAEAIEAYDRIGDPHSRAIVAAVDAIRPLIAADTLREAAQAAEKVTMVYDQDSDDGWRAWMRERALALAESKPCAACGKPAIWIESPTGSWWAHVDRPADSHAAEVRDGR